jgi:hypothetical protein
VMLATFHHICCVDDKMHGWKDIGGTVRMEQELVSSQSVWTYSFIGYDAIATFRKVLRVPG